MHDSSSARGLAEARGERARVRIRLMMGEISLAEALDDPASADVPLVSVLAALPGYDWSEVLSAVREAGVAQVGRTADLPRAGRAALMASLARRNRGAWLGE
ncbi:MAG: hypothetical protein Q4B30_03170 [Coriobacteriaceae bacterium]|nr:hypothetical protein [Coriobacteriaceae bacterium]